MLRSCCYRVMCWWVGSHCEYSPKQGIPHGESFWELYREGRCFSRSVCSHRPEEEQSAFFKEVCKFTQSLLLDSHSYQTQARNVFLVVWEYQRYIHCILIKFSLNFLLSNSSLTPTMHSFPKSCLSVCLFQPGACSMLPRFLSLIVHSYKYWFLWWQR